MFNAIDHGLSALEAPHQNTEGAKRIARASVSDFNYAAGEVAQVQRVFFRGVVKLFEANSDAACARAETRGLAAHDLGQTAAESGVKRRGEGESRSGASGGARAAFESGVCHGGLALGLGGGSVFFEEGADRVVLVKQYTAECGIVAECVLNTGEDGAEFAGLAAVERDGRLLF